MKPFLCLSALVLLFLQTGCGSNNEEKEPEDVYQVTKPYVTDTTIMREYVCQIRAISHIELRALEAGYLEGIYVDEGQYVKKGTLMFKIMPLQYQAEADKAEAEANYARIEYETSKTLADSNVISSNQLNMIKAKYSKAKAELQLARVKLGFTDIRAPFNGLMDRFNVRLGSLLDDGDLLSTLSDNSKMWVYFNVPEAEYLDYKMNEKKDSVMRVQLRMANGQIYPLIGRVETIEADFHNETGTIAFRATFDNPNALLRHGETGNVLMKKSLKDAMIIPQKATFEVLDKKYVYVVGADNIIHPRKVTIIAELPDLYVIGKGLKTGDKILLEGIRKVRDGEKIKYTFEEPKRVMQSLKLHAE